MALEIRSADFDYGETIPDLHSVEGGNASPRLAWSGAPAGTKSFALIVEDPDAPGHTWTHWLLWNIPVEQDHLDAGAQVTDPLRTGLNDFGHLGYDGPDPPRGDAQHRYYFRLFALDVPDLGPHSGVRRVDLERVLGHHVLGHAEYMGTFAKSKVRSLKSTRRNGDHKLRRHG